jgi:hypothetical protein
MQKSARSISLREYLDLLSYGYHFDEFDQDITVINPQGKEETIVLGALKSFLDQGYTVPNTSNLTKVY